MERLDCALPDLDATQRLGRLLGSLLFPGAVVALVGSLGAGKTHLTRAIAEGLHVPDSRIVTSPTFVLQQEYTGRLTIFHFDAYRLRSEADFDDLGVQETFADSGVSIVEWADRVPRSIPPEHLRIELVITGETSRHATLVGVGDPYAALVRRLLALISRAP